MAGAVVALRLVLQLERVPRLPSDNAAFLRVVANVAADVMAILQNEIRALRVGRVRGKCLSGENHSNREGNTR